MTLEINLGTAFTGSDLPPKGYRDPIMRAGTKTLFDFTNAYCNPNADGALVAGTHVFKDMVDGGADAAVLRPDGSTPITSLTGKAGLSWADGAGGSISDNVSLGTSQRWAADEPMTWALWFKQSATGATTTYQRWLVRGAAVNANANVGSPYMDSGNSGNNPRGQVLADGGSTGTGPVPASGASLLTRGTRHLLAMSFVPSTSITLFHDGVQVLQQTSAIPAVLEDNAAWNTFLALAGGGVIYRFVADQAEESARTAAEFVAAEWALKNSAFV